MTKKPKDNSVGPWAKEKLNALRQYLSFYTTVLKRQGHWLRGTIFVDAFAGPGLSPVRTKEKAAEGPGLFGLASLTVRNRSDRVIVSQRRKPSCSKRLRNDDHWRRALS